MENARLRPTICPIFPPVIIKDAMTSVYSVIADWIPVTVVPRSLATVAIDTFMTELSSAIRNWPEASVIRTVPEPAPARATGALVLLSTAGTSSRKALGRACRDEESRETGFRFPVSPATRQLGDGASGATYAGGHDASEHRRSSPSLRLPAEVGEGRDPRQPPPRAPPRGAGLPRHRRLRRH